MDRLERYNELYDEVMDSPDPEKQRIFAEAEKWVFMQLAASDPALADKWLDRIEAVDWNNYLSEAEAQALPDYILDADGKPGLKWDFAALAEKVTAFGGKLECAPYYNRYALLITMNLIAADHLRAISRFVAEPDVPELIYNLAVGKLKDIDCRHFIRPHFGL